MDYWVAAISKICKVKMLRIRATSVPWYDQLGGLVLASRSWVMGDGLLRYEQPEIPIYDQKYETTAACC